MISAQVFTTAEMALSQRLLRSFLPQNLNVFEALLLMVISLALMFAGRKVIKVLAFLAVGLVIGAAGALFGTFVLGFLGTLVGGIIGFILGGLLSLALLPVGIGFGAGLIAYDLTLALVHSFIFAIVIGIIFFGIGVALSSKVLSLAAAIFGGLLFFEAITFFGSPILVSAILTILLATTGFWIQDRGRKQWSVQYSSNHGR